jgi:hypothetical protein
MPWTAGRGGPSPRPAGSLSKRASRERSPATTSPFALTSMPTGCASIQGLSGCMLLSGSPDPASSSARLVDADSRASDTPRLWRRGRGAHLTDKLHGFRRQGPHPESDAEYMRPQFRGVGLDTRRPWLHTPRRDGAQLDQPRGQAPSAQDLSMSSPCVTLPSARSMLTDESGREDPYGCGIIHAGTPAIPASPFVFSANFGGPAWGPVEQGDAW